MVLDPKRRTCKYSPLLWADLQRNANMGRWSSTILPRAHGRFMIIKQNVNVTLNVQQTGIVMLGARGVKEKVESPYLPLRAMRATRDCPWLVEQDTEA